MYCDCDNAVIREFDRREDIELGLQGTKTTINLDAALMSKVIFGPY